MDARAAGGCCRAQKNNIPGGGAKIVTYQWVDCGRDVVSRRYDRIAKFIPFFDWLFFVPWDLRRKAVAKMGLGRGDSVLEIGCGTGLNFPYLREAVGPEGRVYGVDISAGMLRQARALRDAKDWRNIALCESDAADYAAPAPLDAVLFSLSYNTMPHHRTVLRRAWQQLRPGGRLVIMDAKVPPGLGGRLVLPFSLWLMKHTMLGNPLIHPWQELGTVAGDVDMSECMFSSYYICSATKPIAGAAAGDRAANDNAGPDSAYHIAAE
jgi:demethylmenaquinone methyltransferase/2-methoxy-6-polyprenyl-1,4-benzoquinol methylase